jgi:hypothetical protein
MIVTNQFKLVIEKLMGDESMLQRFMQDHSYTASLGLNSIELSAIRVGLGGSFEQKIKDGIAHMWE